MWYYAELGFGVWSSSATVDSALRDDHGKAWQSPWLYMPITAVVKPINDSGLPCSLYDEAQPVNIIIDHIDRQTINLAAIVLVTTMTNCITFSMK